MSMRTISRSARPLAAQMAGLLGFAAFALLCTPTASEAAEAAPKVCGDRHQILERLAQTHEEKPQSIGLSVDGGVIEVLVSPEGGWTMLITYPKRPTCVVAVGKAWQTVQIAGQPI